MNFWVGGLPLALGLWGDERVPAWRTVIGCPLKDGEVADVFGDFRNELHSGGTGADDRHPLACEVHFFLRPAGSDTTHPGNCLFPQTGAYSGRTRCRPRR